MIFVLHVDGDQFVLSRNFRTQKIGDMNWLREHYDFSRVAFFIDELIILNVSRGAPNTEQFAQVVRQVVEGCFAPVAAGGGVRNLDDAEMLMQSGADKIVVNHAIFENLSLVEAIASRYGRQAVVASLDAVASGSSFTFVSHYGTKSQQIDKVHSLLSESVAGEMLLTSVDKDGTGQGLSFELAMFGDKLNLGRIPLVLCGGAGKPDHLRDGLLRPEVSAVATANLLNFIGGGLMRARSVIENSGLDLARWSSPEEIFLS